MKTLHVTWVERDESDPCRRIARLGGEGFSHSIMDAIFNLHQGICRYWMLHENAPVWILLDVRPGPAYLRTELDDIEPETLLTLAASRDVIRR